MLTSSSQAQSVLVSFSCSQLCLWTDHYKPCALLSSLARKSLPPSVLPAPFLVAMLKVAGPPFSWIPA